MDESSKQLIGEVREPVPVAPGRPARMDHEAERLDIHYKATGQIACYKTGQIKNSQHAWLHELPSHLCYGIIARLIG